LEAHLLTRQCVVPLKLSGTTFGHSSFLRRSMLTAALPERRNLKMSWLKHAVEFGIGFLEGYAQSRNERRNSNLTFADVMVHFSRETGYRVEIFDARSASFDVPVGGGSRTVIAVESGGHVVLNAVSDIAFPRGAPADVCQVLRRQNQQLAACDFDLVSCQDGDRFMVKTSVRCETITVAIFEVAIREIVPRVAVLDRVLQQCGYGY
jgi:hypothetical protein